MPLELSPVKTDDDLVIHKDNGRGPTPNFLYQLIHRFRIFHHIPVGKRDFVM
jgi:hypothetical protein